MAELAKKKVIRRGQRVMTKKRLDEVGDILTAVDGGAVPDPVKLSQLRLGLGEKLDYLRKLDEEILTLTDDEEEVMQDIEEADKFMQEIYDKLVKIDSCLAAVPASKEPASSSSSYSTQARLPKLNLPKFGGDITEWVTFWDLYQAAVHSNDQISEIEKFTYLQTLLTKEAKDTIAGLALTAANYSEAIALLESRFGNKERIISKHMDTLLALESVSWQGNTMALRALYDKVETHLRALKALGVSPEAYNSLLPSVLMRKLPSELCLNISRRVSEDTWNLDNLMKVLGDELKARERAAPEAKRPGSDSSHIKSRKTGGAATTAALFCGYCRQPHLSEACRKVSNPEARRRILQEEGRCYICLKRGHLSRVCRQNKRCDQCGGRHHISICFRREDTSKPTEKEGRESTDSLNPKAEPFKSLSLFADSKGTILLQTAKATCFNFENKRMRVDIRLAFDSGSQLSYITERVCRKLGLRSMGNRSLKIAAFGKSESEKQSYSVVHLGIESRDGVEQKLTLLAVPFICEPLRGSSTSSSIDGCDHLAGLELADSISEGEVVEIDVLVGLDHYWSFLTGEVIRGGKGPVALYSTLGWILSGPVASDATSLVVHVLTVVNDRSRERVGLDQQLKQFWDLESFGVTSKDDTLYDQFKLEVSFTGERYEVALPWKETALRLPDNYKLCLRRLNALLRRLRQQPELLREYSKAISELVDKGIVERVVDPDTLSGERVHYLPHHCVIRRDKQTTKLRVVYDGSAKSEGVSLNDCLYIGPKFHQYVFDILLRFRLFRCGFAADIEKAFLMIEVAEHDRDALRFLWVSDPNEYPPSIEVLRFARVTFGVACSPFLLNATIRYHLESYCKTNSDDVAKLARSMYVDDVISGADNERDAFNKFQAFKDLLSKGGFNLRKFVCNREKLCDTVELGMHKVLGVNWDIDTDELVLDLSEVVCDVNESECLTKRRMVSVVSRIFDPIGIASPVTIQAKLLLQELHKANIEWDGVIGGELLNRCCKVLSVLRESETIRVPRWYKRDFYENLNVSYRLCGFSDASSKAYAAVVYLQQFSNGEKRAILIASKSRVAPMGRLSIPRLELLGALLLSRLIHSVEKALKTDIRLLSSICYSDSEVVLYWIRGENRDWKPFAQNRVREIRYLVPAASWRHCPGQENPADLPTRGISVKELKRTWWFHGPPWMGEDLIEDPPGEMPSECLQELRVHEMRNETCSETHSDTCSLLVHECKLQHLIVLNNYSSLEKLCRVTAFVLRFIDSIKRSNIEHNVENYSLRAEYMWVVECQKVLVANHKFKEWKHQFQLFKDSRGIWRCGGRLHNANLDYETLHPILLPTTHYFTQLVVRRAHNRVFHNGIKETLTELRTRYWVIKGRAVVKYFVKHCVICRKAEGGTYSVPVPPPLPSFRVRRETPFAYTGVDFAGPLYIRDRVKSESKVWICLFTCCVTRAIHVDIVNNLSVDCFLSCFRRFVARRGFPTKVISDNAKTFKGAAVILQKVVKHPDVSRYFSELNVTWAFNVAKAPWWGGIFERLIQSVKRCLKKTIGRAKLTHEELLTMVTEVEMIVNSRPLTVISEDDIEEPLTPSHLIIGRRISSLPDNLCVPEEDDNFEVTAHFLNKRVQSLHRILDHFWKRWKFEYLLELRDVHRFHNQGSAGPNISVGDVVVIHNEDRKRGFWNLGRIKELISGSDGHNRAAVVVVSNGKGKTTLLKRPVQRLFPLEVRNVSSTEAANTEPTVTGCSDDPSNEPANAVSNPEEVDTLVEPRDSPRPLRRSTRAAATLARDNIKAHLLS